MVLAANVRRLDPIVLWQAAGRWLAGEPNARVRPAPGYLRWLLRLTMVAFLCLGLLHRWADLALADSFVPRRLAVGAARFVAENRPEGRGFNDYESSSFLQWQFAGSPPLFIDLLNAYPDEVSDDYDAIVNVSPRGRQLLQDAGIDWVLLTVDRIGPSLAPLATHLDQSPAWMRVYAGSDGVLWVRHSPEADRRWRELAAVASRHHFGALERLKPVPIPAP
jgi:hypothetical protein